MAYTHATSINKFGVTPLIVATSAANGSHTTLAGAIADAVSGDTIILRDSVTENVTLGAGINIAGWSGEILNVPSITGTITCIDAGTRTISGIRLVTNSAPLLTVSGSAATVVLLTNCYLNCSNNTGISFTTSSPSALIECKNCQGNLGTTGIALYVSTSAGSINSAYCGWANTGGSTTQSSNSSGAVNFNQTNLSIPIVTTSTGVFSVMNSVFDTSTQNATAITGAGTIYNSSISCGSGTSISASGVITCFNSVISSSNTNAISGAGTLNYGGLSFTSSSKINTTTQSGGLLNGGQTQAPSTGFIGQSISSTATGIATSSTTAKTIASIALTPGVWNVSAISSATGTGGTTLIQAHICNISTTDNTVTGTQGIEYFQTNVGAAAAATVLSGSVPSYRVTLTANTTYYLVCLNIYSSTTAPTNGRISATRVG